MKQENTSLRLKKLMQEENLRQVDILELTKPFCEKYDVKMNKSDISQYVSGKVEPSQDKLVVLGMALSVSEAWLMGYDVPMNSKISANDAWDIEAAQFEDKINALYYQLRSLGWAYEWIDSEEMYLFSNGTISFKVSNDKYCNFVEDAQNFCKVCLEKLYEQSKALLFPNNKPYIEPVIAAHVRTDIAAEDITDEMKQNDMDIMNDPDF